jgi:two-component system sensor histidine kinase/response regulator
MENSSALKSNVSNILIVDDTPANLKILSEILSAEGYKVRPVPNGKLALQVAEREKPDLILLDIMMPDMNGYQVCQQLKEDQNLSDVPVIFISALNDTNDIVKALTTGGVDYITKPFQAEEVKARVKTHLKIHRQEIELQELNITKDKFFSIISHDLRNSLGGFMGLTEMMADESQQFSIIETKELMANMRDSARNVFDLLENLLEWSRMQRHMIPFNTQPLHLANVAAESTANLTEQARLKGVELALDIPATLKVNADVYMLGTIIRNFTSNALKFTPKGGEVRISAKQEANNTAVISVSDTGIGMSSKLIDNLFCINVNTSRPGTEGEASTGLGLILCKEFVAKHGGTINVKSEENNGSTFSFSIPLSN